MDSDPRSWWSTDLTAPTGRQRVCGALVPTLDARYLRMDILGAGGMGEVHLCNDVEIGREVALKVSRTTDARFLQEAKIQARLQHPAIVPVHEIGRTAGGEFYFTMKRVRGSTLEDLLVALRCDASGVPITIRKLVHVLASVCLAVDFAHARGILHRDIKPANIMLGDFGEVHLLDWGLAKRLDAPDVREPTARHALAGSHAVGPTAPGTIVGTPGFMAPEQLVGGTLDRRTDVYALGAVLFETLALAPLHLGNTTLEVLQSTRAGVDVVERMRRSGRDVAPELQAICVRATALVPDDRFATARELHDALDRYLEGARDSEHRGRAAEAHARAAEDALARAAVTCEHAEQEARAEAAREVTSALALDPANERARVLLVRVLTEPLRALPQEVRAAMERAEKRASHQVEHISAWMLAGWVLVYLVLCALGVIRDVGNGLVGCGALGVAIVLCHRIAAREDVSHALDLARMACLGVALVATSRTLGPLLLAPTIAGALAVGYASKPRAWQRAAGIVMALLAIAVPLLLEELGLWPATYAFRDGLLIVTAQVNERPSVPMLPVLVLSNVWLIVAPALWMAQLRKCFTRAETKLELQTWQLRRLLPEGAIPSDRRVGR